MRFLVSRRRVHVAKSFRTRYRRQKSPREKERISRRISAVSALVFIIVLTVYSLNGSSDWNETAAEYDTETTETANQIDIIMTGNELQENAKDISGIKGIPLIVSALKNDSANSGVAGQRSDTEKDTWGNIEDKYLEEISDHSVKVMMEDGSVREIPLESYVAGVVASEMPSSFDFEALKAQAVAARTYVTAKDRDLAASGAGRHVGACVCTTSCCQVYRDVDGLRSAKSAAWLAEDYNKVKQAVAETAGELLYYDGELVSQPLFFSASGGSTENSEDVFASAVPYLRSVTSSLEAVEKYDGRKTSFSLDELEEKLTAYIKAHPKPAAPADYSAAALPVKLSGAEISVESRTAGGGAAVIRFGDIKLTGRQVRELLSLPSADITVQKTADTVTFITNGNGHRVGLSQYGADAMGKAGSTYKQILAHYYSGTEVKKI